MLNWIIGSSIFIMAVFILQKLFDSRISAFWRYALWFPVMVRLLIPVFLFTSSFSIQHISNSLAGMTENLAQRMEESAAEAVVLPEETLESVSAPTENNAEAPAEESISLPENAADGEDGYDEADYLIGKDLSAGKNNLFLLWIAGMLVTGFVLFGCNLVFRIRLHSDREEIEPEILEKEGLPDRIPVYVTEKITTPCMAGIRRPAVYFPKNLWDTLDNRELSMVLLHETIHYRHKDHIWSFFRLVCLVLHWYNPLVWMAALESKQDAELFCDDTLLGEIGRKQIYDYGSLLIQMTLQDMSRGGKYLSGRMRHAGICNTEMIDTEKRIQTRIRCLSENKRKKLWVVLPLLFLCAGICAFVFSGIPRQSGQEDGRPVIKKTEEIQADKYEALWQLNYVPEGEEDILYNMVTLPDAVYETEDYCLMVEAAVSDFTRKSLLITVKPKTEEIKKLVEEMDNSAHPAIYFSDADAFGQNTNMHKNSADGTYVFSTSINSEGTKAYVYLPMEVPELLQTSYNIEDIDYHKLMEHAAFVDLTPAIPEHQKKEIDCKNLQVQEKARLESLEVTPTKITFVFYGEQDMSGSELLSIIEECIAELVMEKGEKRYISLAGAGADTGLPNGIKTDKISAHYRSSEMTENGPRVECNISLERSVNLEEVKEILIEGITVYENTGMEEPVPPTKEEVEAMYERATAGMSEEEIADFRQFVKDYHQFIEYRMLDDNMEKNLSDKDALLWNYFTTAGTIQTSWYLDRDPEEFPEYTKIPLEELYAKYGEPIYGESLYDTERVVKHFLKIRETIQNETLRKDIDALCDALNQGTQDRDVRYIMKAHEILHDLDYFLLRYGPVDVGQYAQDKSLASRYYGVLEVWDDGNE